MVRGRENFDDDDDDDEKNVKQRKAYFKSF